MFEIIMDCWLIFLGSYFSSKITYKLVKLAVEDKRGWWRDDPAGNFLGFIIYYIFGLFALAICLFAGILFFSAILDASREISNNNNYLEILFLCGATFSLGFLYFILITLTK